jgi:gliding motility-associated-like protein
MIKKYYLHHILILLVTLFLCGSAGAQGNDPELIIDQHEYAICSGEEVEAQIFISGEPPVGLIYEFNSQIDTVVSSSNTIYLTFDVGGICYFLEYKDYEHPLIATSDSIVITENYAPHVTFEGGGFICDINVNSPLVAHFQGEPPFVLICLINDIPDTVHVTGYTYTFDLSYDFQLITQEVWDAYCKSNFIDTFYYRIGDIPIPEITGDSAVCTGSRVVYSTDPDMYNAIWSVPGVAVYDVDSATHGSFVTINWVNEGDFEVRLKLVNFQNGCESQEAVMNVVVFPSPTAPVAIDTTVCLDEAGSFSYAFSPEPGETVNWPTIEVTGPSVTLDEEGFYPFILTNEYGCTDTGSINLINSCIPKLFVPEAFTPNGDGINDVLPVFGTFHYLEFSVYSPGGSLLFRSEGESVNWDGTSGGTVLPGGSYFWSAVYYNNEDSPYKKSGVVTIIR